MNRRFAALDRRHEIARAAHLRERRKSTLEKILQRRKTREAGRLTHQHERATHHRLPNKAIQRDADFARQQDLALALVESIDLSIRATIIGDAESLA